MKQWNTAGTTLSQYKINEEVFSWWLLHHNCRQPTGLAGEPHHCFIPVIAVFYPDGRVRLNPDNLPVSLRYSVHEPIFVEKNTVQIGWGWRYRPFSSLRYGSI